MTKAAPRENHITHREQWLRQCFSDFEKRLLAYAHRITRDRAAAQDAVQNTFLKLCRQEKRDVNYKLAEWLHTVCRHEAISLLRDRGKRHRFEDLGLEADDAPCPRPNPSEEGERRDSEARILKAVRELPDPQRDVFILKFQQGLKYRQIAEVTGLSVSHVGVLLHTALRSLRTELRHDLALDGESPPGAKKTNPKQPLSKETQP